MKKYLRTFHALQLFCNKSYMCMQCDLFVTAVYFKRLLIEFYAAKQ